MPVAVFLVALVAVSLAAVKLDRNDPVLVPKTDRVVTIARSPAELIGPIKPVSAVTRVVADPVAVAHLRRLIDHTPTGAYNGFGCSPGDIRYRLDFATHAGGPTDTTVVVHTGDCYAVTVTRGRWRHVGHDVNPELGALLFRLTS